MRRSLEVVLGLLDTEVPALLSAEDFAGPMAPSLDLFERMGFLPAEPGMNPVPSCQHCLAGTPYRLAGRHHCNCCGEEVSLVALQIRRLEPEPLLGCLARVWGLCGGVVRLADGLWRLGSLEEGAQATECFYLRGENLPDASRRRLLAYRSVIVLHGKPRRPEIEGYAGRYLALVDVLCVEEYRLVATSLLTSERRGGVIRFDRRTGALYAGDELLGRIPPGSREFHLIAMLADYPGEVVPYAELKRHVGAATGSRDETEEATFCHKLKSRIKHAHGITIIDRLIRTDRRGGGYLLEAALEFRS